MSRKILTLRELPSTGRTYARALAARGSGQPRLEPVELRVAEVRVDAEHLAAYQQLLEEPVCDSAPAGYLFVLSFPLALQLMTRPGFPLRAVGMVHLRNHVVQNHAVRIGDTVGLRTWAQGLRAHRAGTQVEIVSQALDADGDVAWEQVSTFLAKGTRLPGLEPAPEREREFSPPTPTASWSFAKDVGRRYAAVSGDRNPIHLSSLAARAFGYPRAIAHGMYTAARALAAVGPARGEACTWEIDFGRPVLLPATVAVRVAARDEGPGFETAVWDPRSGKPHLTGTVTPIG